MSAAFRRTAPRAAPLVAGLLAACFGRIPVDPKGEVTGTGDTGATSDDTGTTSDDTGGGNDTGQPGPQVAVSPASLDFGEVLLGCEAAEVITIENHGSADLSVETISVGGDASFDLTVPSGGPWTLAPGEAMEATVGFAPTAADEASGTVVVTSDDPDDPAVTVDLLGAGAAPAEQADAFEQAIVDDAEVIFAVDTSGSMYDDLAGFVAGFPSFVSELDASGIDAHISAVLFGDRCAVLSNPPWFDTGVTTAELADILEAVLEDDGMGGGMGDDESAFVTWTEAWGRSGSGQCNDGLFDTARDLNLVGVSDEADSKADSWADYVADFQAVNPTVRFHAIGGPPATGCGSALYYAGLYEAVDDTGGAFLSICDDWTTNFATLADAVVTAALGDTFALSADPDPDTIAVTVDGDAATGWSYDAGANAVVFDADAVPPLGAEVVVRYEVAASCG